MGCGVRMALLKCPFRSIQHFLVEIREKCCISYMEFVHHLRTISNPSIRHNSPYLRAEQSMLLFSSVKLSQG